MVEGLQLSYNAVLANGCIHHVTSPMKAASPGIGRSEDHKILGIELLRFLSSVAVLVFHYQHFLFVGNFPVGLHVSQQPLFEVLGLFYVKGFYGVEVFWCISGFIFFWKYGRQLAAGAVSGYVFFVLRLSRLYPLHFATLLIVAALQWVYFGEHGTYFIYPYNDPYHFVLQLFMASNWGLQLGDSFNGPIWSISIEVLVYTLFFLSLRYVSNSPLFLACVAAAGALVQVLKLSGHPFFNCVMFFYLGCLTAVLHQRSADIPRARRWVNGVAVAWMILMLVASHLVTIKANYFLVLFVPPLILFCVMSIPSSGWVEKLLIPAGNMTYASYLLHVPLQFATVLVCAWAGIHIPFYNPLFLASFLVVTLVLSHWTYEYFEMPAQKWVRRLLSRRPAGVAAAMAPRP
jgi:peptidoglycan/LPS O-acetylase OafA/YrhL